MQRTLLFAALAPMLVGLYACDDLGKCTDPNQGRNPILTPQGRVMYAGQAILIASCATGCHASNAKGEARKGAPAGLDFDIVPLDATGLETLPDKTVVATTTDSEGVAGLRRRQRKVFEEREDIWEQIQKDLMPPDGSGFEKISAGSPYTQAADGSCTRGTALDAFSKKATQKVLKQWLACGAPIVEMNSAKLTKPVGGTIGDQYPACGGGAMMTEPTFDNVYAMIIQPSCVAGCHEPGGSGPSDFTLETIDVAYTAFVGADGKGAPQDCATNTDLMVKPGDSASSYLIAKLGAGGDYCDSVMPIGTPLPADQIDLIKRWIDAGAPAPGKSAGGGDAGM